VFVQFDGFPRLGDEAQAVGGEVFQCIFRPFSLLVAKRVLAYNLP
jgi:hypothetical protein